MAKANKGDVLVYDGRQFNPFAGGGAGQVLTGAGTGSLPTWTTPAASGGAALFQDYTDASTSHTDGTEDTLSTHTLAAGQLAATGDRLTLIYGGSFLSSATATRQLKLYWGTTAIFDSGSLVVSLSAGWQLTATIVRAAADKIRYSIVLLAEGAPLPAYMGIGKLESLTLANAYAVKLAAVAAGVGAASADIFLKVGVIDYRPGA